MRIVSVPFPTFCSAMSTSVAACAADAGQPCATVRSFSLSAVTIVAADHVLAGAMKLEDQSLGLTNLPAFCRVVGVIKPRPRSEIHFEAWLPDTWNGRYLQAGNGGFAGSIAYPGLVSGLKNGFAVTNSDGGHRSKDADMSWALASKEVVEDFGNRALYETAHASKELVAKY